MSGHDLVLAGGGLACGLLAYRLGQLRPDLSCLVLEGGERPGGNHTWCFHLADLTADQREWLSPFVARRWDSYDVRFPGQRRRLDLGYGMVTSERFASVVEGGGRVRCGQEVVSVAPRQVALRSGEVLDAGAVVDGRGFGSTDGLVLARQTFLGQELRLRRPHGLARPVLMDATVAQLDGYRFVYLLPLSETDLLVEDTYYTERAIEPDTMRARVADYVASRGWEVAGVLREEQGCLPITLDGDFEAFWRDADPEVARVGLRAGLFHPTTGYSLPHAVRLADHVARLPDLSPGPLAAAIRRFSAREWRQQGFYRLLNRMLLRAGPSEQRYGVLRRFYTMPEPTISRFYAGRLSLLDKARLLTGKPPVPFFEALRLVPRLPEMAS